MRYEFHPEAFKEYNEAGFYYAQKEPGLDLHFIIAVEDAIGRLLEDPCATVASTRMSADV